MIRLSGLIILLVICSSISSVYSYHNHIISNSNSKCNRLYSSSRNSNDIMIKTNLLIVPLIVSSILMPNVAYAKVLSSSLSLAILSLSLLLL